MSKNYITRTEAKNTLNLIDVLYSNLEDQYISNYKHIDFNHNITYGFKIEFDVMIHSIPSGDLYNRSIISLCSYVSEYEIFDIYAIGIDINGNLAFNNGNDDTFYNTRHKLPTETLLHIEYIADKQNNKISIKINGVDKYLGRDVTFIESKVSY